MSEAGFKITRGKGFQITFQNGYTVSVQFGFGNYCKNHFDLTLADTALQVPHNIESPDAEVAVWQTDGEGLVGPFIDLPQFGIDQVGGWKSPEEILEILNWAKEQK